MASFVPEKYRWTLATSSEQTAAKGHDDRVAAIVDRFRSRPAGQLCRIQKNTPTHQIHNFDWKRTTFSVDVSAMNNILAITRATENPTDAAGYKYNDGAPIVAYAWCESQVQMSELVTATLPLGLMPCVVPEYTNFTVGGLINGDGIQTSSFRYGTFISTAVAIEAILGTGDVVFSDERHNQFVHDNIKTSYGTLGIILSARIALRSAKPFVKSLYSIFDSSEVFARALFEKTRSGSGDFLEGLVLARDAYLIVESSFVDEPGHLPLFEPGPQRWDRGEKFYYQYINQDVVRRAFSGKHEVLTRADCIPTFDFVFRSERGAYWMVECHVNLPWLTNASWFRKYVTKMATDAMNERKGWFNPNEKLKLEDQQRCYVLQDMGILLKRLQEGIDYVNDKLGVYPLWICPVRENLAAMHRITTHKHDLKGNADCEWVVDIGVYGEPTVQPYRHRRVLRDLANFVDFPSTWGVSYESKESFRKRFDPIRNALGAVGVFVGREDKVTFRATTESNLDEGPIFLWRLVRDHGYNWPVKVIPGLLIAIAVLGAAIYGTLIGVMWVFARLSTIGAVSP